MTRTHLELLALLVAGCAATQPMPASAPLRDQTQAAMEQDRAECEQVALDDPAVTLGTSKGGKPTAYWEVGAPWCAACRQMTRQRQASFAACMEPSPFRVYRAP